MYRTVLYPNTTQEDASDEESKPPVQYDVSRPKGFIITEQQLLPNGSSSQFQPICMTQVT